MTIRLSAMFEEHIKTVINSWKSSERGKRKATTTQNERPKRVRSNPPRQVNGAGV